MRKCWPGLLATSLFAAASREAASSLGGFPLVFGTRRVKRMSAVVVSDFSPAGGILCRALFFECFALIARVDRASEARQRALLFSRAQDSRVAQSTLETGVHASKAHTSSRYLRSGSSSGGYAYLHGSVYEFVCLCLWVNVYERICAFTLYKATTRCNDKMVGPSPPPLMKAASFSTKNWRFGR